ncbi:inverse autotransporter beta domain-containing protein [Rouxiella sp. T17]|uniref:inverse autotransporter beta domain-containing protein n=1 Tax=Rouxiella sp. T17 TaxID=3085684 RepID=UPI002FC99ED0
MALFIIFSLTVCQQANAAPQPKEDKPGLYNKPFEGGPVEKDTDAASYASGVASEAASQRVENLLNKFGGSSRITLGTGWGSPHSAMAADLLIPLFDNQKENLFFTQLGFRRIDSRNTLNLGLGSRYFTDSWMFGTNAFFDNDITGKNRRWGLGAEWWTDNLRLSANGYRRITEWHASRNGADLQERPANGWDIEAQSWLPAYPQIGGTLKYEKYYGQNVALISRNSLQSDPSALSAAINWTPVPLVTFEGEHRASMGGKADNRVSVMFNHSFGSSLSASLDPTQVAASRSLQGSRYELVSRNNRIVLDYRKQTLIAMSMNKELIGTAGKNIALGINVSSTHAFKKLRLDAPEFINAGGNFINEESKEASLIFPLYKEGEANTYPLTAVAIDINGKESTPVIAKIMVLPDLSTDNSTAVIDVPDLIANGTATTILSVKLVDKNHNVISGAQSQLSLAMEATKSGENLVTFTQFAETTTLGTYSATIKAGSKEGVVTLVPSFNGQVLDKVKLTLNPNTPVAKVEITSDKHSATINQQIKLTMKVMDKQGDPIKGKEITFATYGSNLTFTDEILMTNSEGIATANVSFNLADDVQIRAYVEGIWSEMLWLKFTENAIPATLTLTSNVIANCLGEFTVVRAVVADKTGKLLAGQTVNFSSNIKGLEKGKDYQTVEGGFIEFVATSVVEGDFFVRAKVTDNISSEVKLNFHNIDCINELHKRFA